MDSTVRSGISFRAAQASDAYAVAELMILAGDGMYEFLLEDLAPKEMLAGLVARTIQRDVGSLSWRYCLVAHDGESVVGMIHAHPAAWLKEQERDILPQERVEVLEPIDQAQDWESFLIASVAVRRDWRRKGIASRFVEWAVERATDAGFPRVSLNVWADNLAARALYEGLGFQVKQLVEVPQHPRLGHFGGSLVMVRDAASR